MTKKQLDATLASCLCKMAKRSQKIVLYGYSNIVKHVEQSLASIKLSAIMSQLGGQTVPTFELVKLDLCSGLLSFRKITRKSRYNEPLTWTNKPCDSGHFVSLDVQKTKHKARVYITVAQESNVKTQFSINDLFKKLGNNIIELPC